ncbi:MAG: MBL fold metallo-hydrolase [Oscillospiraceae bacterium]|nr:MBL fold metallo-hydrolase [Oscillospiraceae bacterium]
MKKTKKIILAIVAAALAIGAGIGLYSLSPMLAMRPAKTGPIPGTEILALRNNRNCLYFLDTGGGWLVIDAGSDAKKVEAGMRKLGIDPADVRWVLLTHSDYDHVAALPLFENAEIYMGEGELGLLDGTVSRNGSGGNKLPDGIDLMNEIHLLPPDGAALLACGDVRVRCTGAPGHTPGSMAYLVSGSWLFTGDAFKFKRGEVSVHPFTMDEAQAKETAAALKGILYEGNLTALTAHYGWFILC